MLCVLHERSHNRPKRATLLGLLRTCVTNSGWHAVVSGCCVVCWWSDRYLFSVLAYPTKKRCYMRFLREQVYNMLRHCKRFVPRPFKARSRTVPCRILAGPSVGVDDCIGPEHECGRRCNCSLPSQSCAAKFFFLIAAGQVDGTEHVVGPPVS